MELIPLINTNMTEDRVRNFLHDEFPQLVMMAGYSMLDIKSPKWSDLPKGTSIANGIEDTFEEHFNAERIVIAVEDVIYRCPYTLQRILELSYIDQLDNSVIMERLNMSESTFYRERARAFRYFAVGFKPIKDLNVYVEI